MSFVVPPTYLWFGLYMHANLGRWCHRFECRGNILNFFFLLLLRALASVHQIDILTYWVNRFRESIATH